MKKKRKLLPIWLLVLIDLLAIAVYVGGFYCIYYRIPRRLDSEKIVTSAAEINNTEGESLTEESLTEESGSIPGADTEEEAGSIKGSDIAASTGTEENSLAEGWDSGGQSYRSEGISVTVEQYRKGTGKNTITYYIADIYITDITSLQTGFADGTYGIGYTDTVLDMAQEMNAILAINGDYYGNGSNGVVIRNGTVYRSTSNGLDVCVLYMDGTMKTYSAGEFDAEAAVADGAWQAWCFGPELLDEAGQRMTEFTADRHISKANPRSAIGYYEPGHYCMVVVDGRQSGYSRGMTLEELSALFAELGCSSAYNLDGGKSSSMTLGESEVNQPCDGGREVSDCIIIKEVD